MPIPKRLSTNSNEPRRPLFPSGCKRLLSDMKNKAEENLDIADDKYQDAAIEQTEEISDSSLNTENKPSEDDPSKNNNQEIKEKETNIPKSELMYSKEAYEDGYDFSGLEPEEQELSKKLYRSKMHMQRVYNKLCLYNDILENEQEAMLNVDVGWGFPKSGVYLGCVQSCQKSMKRDSNELIMRIILDEKTIRNIKFDCSFSNPVMSAIRQRWPKDFKLRKPVSFHDKRPKVRKPLPFHKTEGMLLRVKVENITLKNGHPFSKIIGAKFLSEASERCIDNMINLMIEQSEE